ncbi:COX15/CtaA family protein [Cutibacterium equinum]|uniref:COX15/CtaA family protein n=1 Tax=Cutibacterium equinum TaxID=3016342 RepID=A0ABY7QW73_9ACTN|nr:COX15/CtaA family protein [Cutibacterium equinum]WCC79312.1 COX15/CtaA family protein [Cutibacterium equinum]
MTSHDRRLYGWCIAALITNMGIIVTGAVVRLTGSGLGCDTWPRCTAGTFTPHGEMGIHSYVEFGNRLLTFVLVAVAIGLLVRCYRIHVTAQLMALAWINAVSIAVQAVVGGVSVRLGLNPFVVAVHLLLSVAIILVDVKAIWLAGPHTSDAADGLTMGLVRATVAMMCVVMWLGTVVTGSGPNAGDSGSARTGFDIETVARLHGISVWITVALTLACLVIATTRHLAMMRRWSMVLVAVEIYQAVIGYSQYFAHLNPWLVIWHMVGVAACAAAVGALWCSVRPTPSPIHNQKP